MKNQYLHDHLLKTLSYTCIQQILHQTRLTLNEQRAAGIGIFPVVCQERAVN